MANLARGRRGLVPADNREVEVECVELPPLEELAPDFINPADDRKEGNKTFLAATKRLWAALPDHPTTAVITEVQMLMLFSAVCAWDMGMKGRVTSLVEGRRTLDAFGVTPEAISRRRIDLVNASDAEERLAERRGRRDDPKQLPSFRPTDLSGGS